MILLRVENGKITETVFAFENEQGFPNYLTIVLFLCSEKLETRPAQISHCRRKPHLIRLNHSQFLSRHPESLPDLQILANERFRAQVECANVTSQMQRVSRFCQHLMQSREEVNHKIPMRDFTAATSRLYPANKENSSQ